MVAAVFAFLGAALTFFVTERSDAGPGASSAEVGFLYDMIGHHQQALEIAVVVIRNGEDRSVQMFARDILQQQSYEIGLMTRQLAVWGHIPANRPERAMGWMGMDEDPEAMPGMASDDEMGVMNEAMGADADALFIALMSDHHRGGVAMADAAIERASDPWVIDLARRMSAVQTSEINEMEQVRELHGLSATPSGYVRDDVDAMHEGH